MQITEVRIFLREGIDKKLKAYATITIDNSFVVRNVKIIEGNKGLFVAMPSRKLKGPCPKCSFKNEVGSKYCNNCGMKFNRPLSVKEDQSDDKRESEHRDIAHPITLDCRTDIQNKVLEAYKAEQESQGQSAPEKSETKEPVNASAPTNNANGEVDLSLGDDIEL